MKKIAVVGSGKIGSSIYKTLQNQGFLAQLGDLNPPPGGYQVDAGDYKSLKEWLSKGFEVVLCAMPYYLVKTVATVAADLGIAYFDLTEDREATDYVKSLKSNSVIVPQCGLAPGAVSIITSSLIHGFDAIKSVDIRVGALPLFPNNAIQYYLTWSTNGLVNEYCNLCEVIQKGRKMDVLPLEGYEKISIDGQIYEAFNTSGGIGSLCESLEGKVEKLSYKTIRYVGHHHLMKFLLDDLNLSKNRDLFIKLFDQEVPQTTKDVVIVMVKVVGYRDNKLMEETYSKKIYGDDEQSAIQKTTVGGICGAMMSWLTGQWETKSGFVKQEDIDWHSFTNNFWGGVYLNGDK
jgi:saccharopine dehydrogenase-like NADP-dependent oxidoreductase